jgi:hypothetical protein
MTLWGISLSGGPTSAACLLMIVLLSYRLYILPAKSFLNGAESITASWMPDRKAAEL